MPVTLQPASAFPRTADGHPISVDPENPNCRAKQRTLRFDLLKDPNEPLAVDIEFQEFRHKDSAKWDHRIGRIGIVNTRGDIIYDTYVRYERDENVRVKMAPAVFGVTYQDISIANGAKPIGEAKKDIKEIMSGRTIIGHGMRLDIRALAPELEGNVTTFIDTQHMYGQVSLSTLAAVYLSMSIQDEVHNPAEDATATMLLYLRKYPYQNRTTFKPAPFTFVPNEFPALGFAQTSSKSSQINGKCNSTSHESSVKESDDGGHTKSGSSKKKSKGFKGEKVAWWK
jgi:hypothetical protein